MNEKTAAFIILGIGATAGLLIAALLTIKSGNLIQATFQLDTLTGAQIELYRHTNPEDRTSKKKVGDINPQKSYHLEKKTHYTAKVQGKDIEPQEISIKTGSESSITITIPVELSRNKLQSLLASERSALVQGAQSALAGYLKSYRIDEESIKLAYDGKWAIVPLTYIGSNTLQRDMLFIIFYKGSENWQPKTKPRIAISKLDYPDIPDTAILKAAPTSHPKKNLP